MQTTGADAIIRSREAETGTHPVGGPADEANTRHRVPGARLDSKFTDEQAPQPQSRLVLRLFSWMVLWYMRRQFHAIRIAHADRFHAYDRPLIVSMNHPSWWDPLTCITLYRNLMPAYFHFAPMDAAALRQYGFFRKIGLFPIEMGTARGAAQFLRGGRAVLAEKRNVLWVTPQGEFTDARQRPPHFRPGLGALVRRMESCTILPLAIEYGYWDERLPEALLLCGEPVQVARGADHTAAEWTALLERSLESAQDELAALSSSRNPAHFTSLAAGGVGVGGLYQLWQRLLARLRGEVYNPEHGSIRPHHSSNS